MKHLARSILFLAIFCCASSGHAATKFFAQDAAPATCTKGDMWTDTNATTGERIYSCESTNTWVKQRGAGASDNVTYGNVTAAGGTITAGVGGSTQGSLILKTNTDPVWVFGLQPAASPSAIVSLKMPGAMPTADNSLFNCDINGTCGWTDPSTLSGGSFDEAGDYSPTGEWDFSGATVTGITGGSMTWPSSAGVAVYGGSSTWGSSLTVGTGNNNLVALNGSGQLPFTLDLMDLTSGGTAISPPVTSGYILSASDTGVISWLDPGTIGGASEIADLSDWPSGLSATELGYVNGATSSLQGQINTLSAGAGGTVTVVTSDPYSDAACTGAKYNSANDRFFPCLGGYHTGYVGLTDFSNPTPVTHTLTITDPGNGDKITCSDSDLPTAIDCGDGGTDCVISGIIENAVITGITGVADTGREWTAFTGNITGATYNAGTVTMSADRSGSATFGTTGCATTLASYTTNSAGFAEIFGTTDAGFSFTANATDDICKVKLWVGQILANQNLTLRIGTAKDMSSTYLADSTVAVTTATTGEVEFTLSTTVTGSTTYYVVIDTDAATYGTRAVLNGNGTGTNGFDGTSWVLDASANGRSAYFVIVGDL